MAPLALLYDVHGNLAALEAVLDDATRQGAGSYLLGGDYVLFGPWPEKTLARLGELETVAWIRGNCEREAGEPDPGPENPVLQRAVASLRLILDDQRIAELAALPEQFVVDDTLYCHASPASDMRSFLPEPAADETELLSGTQERRVVFGHTHLPFARRGPAGVELFSPGSVGMPFDGDPRAAYALVHDGARIEHRRVSYDHQSSAAAVGERFGELDWAQTVARRIRTARP